MFRSEYASQMHFLFGYVQWLGNMEQPLRQRQGTESEYLPTELDGISGVDVKTKKDKVVDLSVWPQRS